MTEHPTEGGGQGVRTLPGGAKAALEAVLMVIDEPATEEELAAGLELTVEAVATLLTELQREYSGYTVNAPDMDSASPAGFGSSPRGFELRKVAGGWRIYSRADFA
ncbi:MAG: segregation and condensation protein B, partial [Arthrobacter sp.]